MRGVRDESPVRSPVASSPSSCTGESVDPRERPRRVRNELRDESLVRSRVASSPASCTGESVGRSACPRRVPNEIRVELVERRGCRRRVPNEIRVELVERRGCRRRARSESWVAPSAEAGSSRIRLARRRGVGHGRRAPWRNSDALLDRHLAPARPRGWWIAPDEGRSFGHEPVVRRSQCGADRSLRDVPEGFGEKEESKRPRASLHGAQICPEGDDIAALGGGEAVAPRARDSQATASHLSRNA
jgi:hypothetical protein